MEKSSVYLLTADGPSFSEELHLTAEEYEKVKEHVRTLRGGTITQAELARVQAAERQKDEMLISLWRRLVAGVDIEPGPFTLTADIETLKQMEEPAPGNYVGMVEYEIDIQFPAAA